MVTNKDRKIIETIQALAWLKLEKAEEANQKGVDVHTLLHDYHIIKEVYDSVLDIVLNGEDQ